MPFLSQPDHVVRAKAVGEPLSRQITYRVKIINPHKKRDPIIRDVRQFHGHFSSIIDVKVRLIDEFGDQLPPTTTFNVGYYAGRQQYWIYTEDDLKAMYTKCSSPDIMMWCDGRSDDEGPKSKKQRTEDRVISKREEKEQKVEELTEELMELNRDKLDLNELQYRLWARMIVQGCCISKDTPPDIPAITGVTPKEREGVRKKQKLFKKVL